MEAGCLDCSISWFKPYTQNLLVLIDQDSAPICRHLQKQIIHLLVTEIREEWFNKLNLIGFKKFSKTHTGSHLSAQISGFPLKRVIVCRSKNEVQNYFWIFGSSTLVLMISIRRIG